MKKIGVKYSSETVNKLFKKKVKSQNVNLSDIKTGFNSTLVETLFLFIFVYLRLTVMLSSVLKFRIAISLFKSLMN